MYRDTFVFGAIAGFVGNIPKTIIAWIFHSLGVLRYTFIQIAAGIFVDTHLLDNPLVIVTGLIADWIIAGIMGVIIVSLIRVTGHDFPIIKSLLFSAGLYVVFYGAGMALDVTRASLLTPLPNLLLLFPHLAMGFATGWYIKYYDQTSKIKE